MSEQYYFRLIGDSKIQGPLPLDAVNAQAKPVDKYEAILAKGQTYAELQQSDAWLRVSSLLSGVEEALPSITNTTHCHIFCGGKQQGPYMPQQIKAMWSAGTLTTDTSVFPAGYPD